MADDLGATQGQLAAFGSQLYRSVAALGGGMEILSIVGSLGDTMPVDDLTDMLKSLNETGSSFEKVLSTDSVEIAEALTNPDAKAKLARRGFEVIDGNGPLKTGGDE